MKKLEKKLQQIYQDVFLFVQSRVGDKDQSLDITHSVMETIIKKRSSLRSDKTFKSWAMQIAANKVNDYYRSVQKFSMLHVTLGVSQESDNDSAIDINNIEDVKANILDRMIEEQDKYNIICALQRLEQKLQVVIRLHVICGYTLREVAEILHKNQNTIRTWYARGIVQLKEEFEKLDGENERI